MYKTLNEAKEAFIKYIVEYLTEVCKYSGEALGERTALYIQSQFKYVEWTYNTQNIHRVDGNASDLTADFCCRMLSAKCY